MSFLSFFTITVNFRLSGFQLKFYNLYAALFGHITRRAHTCHTHLWNSNWQKLSKRPTSTIWVWAFGSMWCSSALIKRVNSVHFNGFDCYPRNFDHYYFTFVHLHMICSILPFRRLRTLLNKYLSICVDFYFPVANDFRKTMHLSGVVIKFMLDCCTWCWENRPTFQCSAYNLIIIFLEKNKHSWLRWMCFISGKDEMISHNL